MKRTFVVFAGLAIMVGGSGCSTNDQPAAPSPIRRNLRRMLPGRVSAAAASIAIRGFIQDPTVIRPKRRRPSLPAASEHIRATPMLDE